MNEEEVRVYTLVPSRNRDRYALDEQDGGEEVKIGSSFVTTGGVWSVYRHAGPAQRTGRK